MLPKLTIQTDTTIPPLRALGAQVRAERQRLRVSSTAAAEAAGVSRVTLHRIEKGEPTVAVGAWENVLGALGMMLAAQHRDAPMAAAPSRDPTEWLPVRVRLADYPQLKALAWQVHGTEVLTPVEALDIYERNARHLDLATLSAQEQGLLTALRSALGKSRV